MVGADATEKVLLPKFFYLCEDGVWGVRKACADVFMPVSCVCSPSVRQAELSPLFLNLLKDQSRWVRMAAFQGLGPFISTFADPLITALLQNQNGEIVITDPDQLAERLAKVVAVANEVAERDQKETREREETEMDLSLDEVRNVIQLEETGDTSFEEKRAKTYEEPAEYTSFLFWREPVSDIFVEDIDILEDLDVIETQVEHKESGANEITKVIHEATIEEVKNELSTLDTESSTDDAENKESVDKVSEAADLILEAHVSDTLEKDKEESNDSSDEESERGEETSSPLQSRPTYAQALQAETGRWTALCETSPMSSSQETELQDLALPRGPPQTKQSIVPQLLIDHYVSMIDPSRAQTVDHEIARHCAFSLPVILILFTVFFKRHILHVSFWQAVALTLGRANWPLLRETYESLANDMQWKVRRTVASSIHELGVILGEEIAAEDLVPIFDGFIKDLDEVSDSQ